MSGIVEGIDSKPDHKANEVGSSSTTYEESALDVDSILVN